MFVPRQNFHLRCKLHVSVPFEFAHQPAKTANMPPKTSTRSSNAPRKPTPSAAKSTYLILYNALSAALWAGVLYKTVTVGTHEVLHGGSKGFFQFGKNRYGGLEALGSGKVYDELERYTRLTQTLAGLEVVHSLTGTNFPFLILSSFKCSLYSQASSAPPSSQP